MANNSWTKAKIIGAAESLDAVVKTIESTVEEAQSWNPRPWIQLEGVDVEGDDVCFSLMTDWQNGDGVVSAIAEKLTFDVTGSFDGECDPPSGTFSY